MRTIPKTLFFILLLSCNQANKKTNPQESGVLASDSTIHSSSGTKDSGSTIIDSANSQTRYSNNTQDPTNEKALIELSEQILELFKKRQFTGLSSFFHPQAGVRFSPYAYINTKTDQLFTKDKLLALSHSQKSISWGLYDGTEKPIKLSIDGYMKKFVYDVDFLNAEKKVVNKFLGGGNSLNNLKEIYPGCDFVEFYFSGFDPQFDGMDWRSLVLVYKYVEKKTYLIAVVHDQWTI